MEDKYTFFLTLTWCKKHKNWWATNCPDCMVDFNEPTIKMASIREVVGWIDKTFAGGITKAQMMATNTWQVKLQKWGIE